MNSLQKINGTAGIILSGGESSRMGIPKALLQYSNNISFADQIIHTYCKASISKMALVLNHTITWQSPHFQDADAICIPNPKQHLGRLFSIQLAFEKLPKHDFYFIHNIDNPFVNANLLTQLYSYNELADAVLPVYDNKGGHPVLLSHHVMQHIAGVTDYKLTLKEILTKFKCKRIESPLSCLMNVNTPQDYQNIFNTLPKMVSYASGI
jgi:molybdenum cofactor cytidylyltransferase